MISLTILAACSRQTPETAIRDAAVLWLIQNASTDLGPEAIYCLNHGGADPSQGLIEVAERSGRVIAPVSACIISQRSDFDSDRQSVFHRNSGLPAVQLDLGRITMDSERSATVELGYLQGGLWGVYFECSAELASEGWFIDECHPTNQF